MSKRLVVIAVVGLLFAAGLGTALHLLDREPAGSPPGAPAPDAPATTPPDAPPPAGPEPAPAPRTPAPTPPAETRPPAPAPVEAAPTTGSLRVTSDVPETSVFVNREFLGHAPVTKTDLAPGSHTVVLSPTGYDMISREVEVAAGEQTDLYWDFKTIRLDAAVAVVHDHAFGSCEGTLRGTPEGIRYETSNSDDAFAVAFADIETFTMDYLEATLQVTIRNGRTYNFTNEDRDPEPLFAFHRDVDRVRARVVGGGSTGVRR